MASAGPGALSAAKTGSRAGGGGAWPGLRPAAWRQRKRRSVPAESERYTACVEGEGFFFSSPFPPLSLSPLSRCNSSPQSTSVNGAWLKVELVPLSDSSSSSTAAASAWRRLGAGCTQVGTWLRLGKSSTRFSGDSAPSSP